MTMGSKADSRGRLELHFTMKFVLITSECEIAMSIDDRQAESFHFHLLTSSDRNSTTCRNERSIG